MFKKLSPEHAKLRLSLINDLRERLPGMRKHVTSKHLAKLREQKLAEGGEVAGADGPHKGRDPEAGKHKEYPFPGFAEGGTVEDEEKGEEEGLTDPEAEKGAEADLEAGEGKTQEDDGDDGDTDEDESLDALIERLSR